MIDLSATPTGELKIQAKTVQFAEPDGDIARRTLLAWLKSKDSRQYQDPLMDPVLVAFQGKLYAGITIGKLVLAVYRVRNDRQLKRLRRIPSPICAAMVLNGKGRQQDGKGH